ncbi:MAG: ABC transporter substrate-binding protein [Clostridia bacterium]|nr:ABC transporter substrate-binding protein [Clostridia bacterium]
MKTTKKILCLVLAMILAIGTLALTSCGGAKYNVGVIQLTQHPALDAATKGFEDALKARLGDDVSIDVQNAAGSTDTCATIAGTFETKKVDLIMANATPALQAAANATTEIPILGTSITEYGVALEIENFSGTVGGNISGTSDLAPLDQQADMISDLFPEAKKVAMLYCSAEANSLYQVQEVTKFLTAKSIECQSFPFSDSNDVQMIAQNAADWADVIYIPTDNTAANCAEAIWGAIADKKVPVIAGEEGICGGTGVATLSIDYYDLGYKTGEMAADILEEKADVSTLAIAYTPAEKLKKKYNKDICDALGINTADLEAKGYVAIEK